MSLRYHTRLRVGWARGHGDDIASSRAASVNLFESPESIPASRRSKYLDARRLKGLKSHVRSSPSATYFRLNAENRCGKSGASTNAAKHPPHYIVLCESLPYNVVRQQEKMAAKMKFAYDIKIGTRRVKSHPASPWPHTFHDALRTANHDLSSPIEDIEVFFDQGPCAGDFDG